MKPFIFCIGLPGNGKTTSSKLLEKQLNGYIRYSSCDLRKKWGLIGNGSPEEVKKLNQRTNDYINQLNSSLNDSNGLIIDKLGVSEQYRKMAYEWASNFGVEELVICHDVCENVAKEKILNRISEENNVRGFQYVHNDPRVLDKYKQSWIDPAFDLVGDKYPHVSLICWDYANRSFKDVKVSPSIASLVQEVKDILLRSLI